MRNHQMGGDKHLRHVGAYFFCTTQLSASMHRDVPCNDSTVHVGFPSYSLSTSVA